MIFAFFLFSLIISPQQTVVKGGWTLDFNQSLALSSAARQSDFNNFNAARQQRIKNLFDGRTFRFNDDGSLLVSWMENGSARSYTSTWVQSGAAIAVTDEASQQQTWQVTALDAAHLVVNLGGDGGLFTSLYLNRIQN